MLETDTRPEGEVTRCIWQQHSVPSHEDKVACHSDEYDSMRRAGGRPPSERGRLPLPNGLFLFSESDSLSVRSVRLQSAI